MNDVNKLIEKRKNRAIAIILSTKDRECDAFLTNDASYKMRKVILDQINELFEYTSDIIEALTSGAGVAVNEYYLEKLAEIAGE